MQIHVEIALNNLRIRLIFDTFENKSKFMLIDITTVYINYIGSLVDIKKFTCY